MHSGTARPGLVVWLGCICARAPVHLCACAFVSSGGPQTIGPARTMPHVCSASL